MNMPSSYTEAKRCGADRYFTGQPCKAGHVCERSTARRSCIECQRAWGRRATRNHYAKNGDVIREKARVHEAQKRAEGTSWQSTNKAAHAEMKAAWKKANPHRVRQDAMERIAFRLNATPEWLSSADAGRTGRTGRIYKNASDMTAATGVKHEVDHMVPLRGKTVCGLHVHWNLRVITAEENNSRPRVWDPSQEI